MSILEPREELASIAASLRAYLEWQVDCGSSGIPRRPREARAAAVAVQPTTPGVVTSAPEPTIAEKDDPPAPPLASPSSNVRSPAPPSDVPDSFTPGTLPPIMLAESTMPAPAVRAKPAAPPPVQTAVAPPRPLPVLLSEVSSCTKCGLHETRTNTVFSRGNPEAKLCFVGEAPGADEDAQGLPFVGRAGQLLDKMIKATQVDPKVIVALGNTSVGTLLGTTVGITRVRGTWKLYRGKIPVMPTYHPSYLLRPSPQQSEAKRQAWEDLQAVMKELGLSKPAR